MAPKIPTSVSSAPLAAVTRSQTSRSQRNAANSSQQPLAEISAEVVQDFSRLTRNEEKNQDVHDLVEQHQSDVVEIPQQQMAVAENAPEKEPEMMEVPAEVFTRFEQFLINSEADTLSSPARVDSQGYVRKDEARE